MTPDATSLDATSPDATSPDATSPGIDRRSFLRHAGWAGAAVAVAVTGGVVTTDLIRSGRSSPKTADFKFVQISDSHLGFQGKANPDVTGTFQQSIELINGLPDRPDFVIPIAAFGRNRMSEVTVGWS